MSNLAFRINKEEKVLESFYDNEWHKLGGKTSAEGDGYNDKKYDIIVASIRNDVVYHSDIVDLSTSIGGTDFAIPFDTLLNEVSSNVIYGDKIRYAGDKFLIDDYIPELPYNNYNLLLLIRESTINTMPELMSSIVKGSRTSPFNLYLGNDIDQSTTSHSVLCFGNGNKLSYTTFNYNGYIGGSTEEGHLAVCKKDVNMDSNYHTVVQQIVNGNGNSGTMYGDSYISIYIKSNVVEGDTIYVPKS